MKNILVPIGTSSNTGATLQYAIDFASDFGAAVFVMEIDRELGIDLLVLAPCSNDIREEMYLGNTSGRIVKKTQIPILVVPKGTEVNAL